MKKTLLACLAVATLLAIATPAYAITCTVDQRPAATLLVPFFQVGRTGVDALDTLVTIGNASSAPMIAHVNVYDRFSRLRLDFNIALSGFDIQALRMSDVITGSLPNTPTDTDGVPTGDVCQRQGPPGSVNAPAVYPTPGGYLRVHPATTAQSATPLDESLATTDYSGGGTFDITSQLSSNVGDDGESCPDDGELDDLAIGYIVIDHVNYCNLSDPTDPNYYDKDAIGMENNLFGEIIFTSGDGLPTYAMSTVNIEADPSFGTLQEGDPTVRVRTFYAKFWNPATESFCTNCGSGNQETDLNFPGNANWDEGFGDQREPLGLRYAARWFDNPGITTNFRVWRSSEFVSFPDFCTTLEPEVALSFFDEDEETFLSGPCPSPCVVSPFNFSVEANQRNISNFRPLPGGVAGWVSMDFASNADELDQAWVDYSFESDLALETILVPATQLDPSTCNPVGITTTQVVTPAIPAIVGIGF